MSEKETDLEVATWPGKGDEINPWPVEICPNCTVHFTPDPDVGGGKPVCPVCETRKQCEHLMGQFMQLLKGKKDKRPPSKQKRIIVPAKGRFR